ncbi:RHS repeat-associated core domain-containing protein [Curtobacterium sp. 24E2]
MGLPAGVALTGSGGVSVAGLEWLGARVYDPAVRGFLSVDPLAPILGAAWSGNPYSYAGNDPLQAVDPLGLRPATDKDLQAYRDANQGAIAAAGSWWNDNWEYVAAGAAIGLGVALMFTGVGGPAGIALMAASGALLSGGVSVASQKAQTGKVDWGRVGVDTAVGGVLGAAGGGAMMFGKAAMAGAPAGQAARAVAVNMGVNGGVGAVSGGVTNLQKNGWQIRNGWEFAGDVVGGGVTGAAGGMAGPAGGTIAKEIGYSASGALAQGTSLVLSGASTAAGTAVSQVISGDGVDLGTVAQNGATGMAGTYVSGRILPGQHGVDTLAQMPYFHPRTPPARSTSCRRTRAPCGDRPSAVRSWEVFSDDESIKPSNATLVRRCCCSPRLPGNRLVALAEWPPGHPRPRGDHCRCRCSRLRERRRILVEAERSSPGGTGRADGGCDLGLHRPRRRCSADCGSSMVVASHRLCRSDQWRSGRRSREPTAPGNCATEDPALTNPV